MGRGVGDTIFLANGTFSGEGNRDVDVYDESIVILSESGMPALCIIDCGGSASENHQAFDCRVDAPDQVVIVGVTMRGGYGTAGPGIYAVKYSAGGGVVIVANCVFSENFSQWDGAVVVYGDCQLSLAGCQFTGNTGGGGGGLSVCDGGTAFVTACQFTDNVSAYNGGAALIGCGGEAYATFTNCTFSGNSAVHYYGGAIYSDESGTVLLGCRFERNSAESQGGALYLRGELSMTDCVCIGNTAEYGGSSLYSSTSDPIAITTAVSSRIPWAST